MNSHHLLLTRRQLFGRTASGIGTVALASLLNERLFAADPALKTHGALPVLHYAPKAKHVIYLFMSGGPLAHRPVRLQTAAQAAPRQGAPRLRPHGPAHHRHDLRPEVVPVRRPHVRVQAARPERHLDQRAAAAHRDGRRRHLHRQVDATPKRSTTTPRSPSSRPAPSSPAGPASARGSATASAARTRTCPRSSCMISQGSGNKTDQPIFSRLWGSGFLPIEHQGVRFRSGGDPVLYLSNPPGIDRDTRRADARRPRPR